MKVTAYYIITLTSLLFISCRKENKKEDKKDIVETKTKGNYISKKWKSTKEIFINSDSLINARKTSYFDSQKKKYPEFASVQKWFQSKPKELLNLNGDFYKMLKGDITDEGTITHVDLIKKSEFGTYKYLYITEDAYFIYDLALENKKIIYKSVRRIKKGYGKQPMHDLVFDKNMELEKEIFQGNVSQDLFTKNGHLFFEFEKSVNDDTVNNTIDLGIERKF